MLLMLCCWGPCLSHSMTRCPGTAWLHVAMTESWRKQRVSESPLRRSGAPGHRQHWNLQIIKALVPHFPAGTRGVLVHLYLGVKMAALQLLPSLAETLVSNSTS